MHIPGKAQFRLGLIAYVGQSRILSRAELLHGTHAHVAIDPVENTGVQHIVYAVYKSMYKGVCLLSPW